MKNVKRARKRRRAAGLGLRGRAEDRGAEWRRFVGRRARVGNGRGTEYTHCSALGRSETGATCVKSISASCRMPLLPKLCNPGERERRGRLTARAIGEPSYAARLADRIPAILASSLRVGAQTGCSTRAPVVSSANRIVSRLDASAAGEKPISCFRYTRTPEKGT